MTIVTKRPLTIRPLSKLSIVPNSRDTLRLQRYNDIIEIKLPHEQAGFHKGRSTTDQIVCRVNDIEVAFQRKEKVGVVYIDLTAA